MSPFWRLESKSMTAHHTHHFVPASYFRPWCTADKKLSCFKWENDHFIVGRSSPKRIASKSNLYSLHGAPANKLNIVETGFFTPYIDQPGAVMHQKILSGNITTLLLEQRHQWARYLMAIRARTPEAVEMIQRVSSEGVRDALRQNPEKYEAIKPVGAPSSLEACIESWYLDNFGLARVIHAVIDKEDTRNAIVDMHWQCRDFSECSFELLTCDRPLIWNKCVDDDGFFLAIPLSPKVGFFAVKKTNTWSKLCELPLRDLARMFNESIVNNAVKYVYAKDDSPQKFIQKRLRHI